MEPVGVTTTSASDRPTLPPEPDVRTIDVRLARAEGVELLGPVPGSGYRTGVGLVRRSDGQVVQLGTLLYGLLAVLDGQQSVASVSEALTQEIGRRVAPAQVERLAQKLAGQGLLAGSEHRAPPRRSPLLALRWKVLVTDPQITRRLTQPFAFLFRPVIMWPVVAAFLATCWYVLVDKGVAGATAQAFHSPGLLLLVFVLAVASAGFHEFGHAAACRYAGATPGGMGMGLYLVWPAFYTDVTEAYQLPKRDRLRVDLGGLYFNALVAVATMVVWLFWRVDALLLLVGLQILQMVRQLSPIIRADGYHILSDLTGVPDLFAHIGPTMARLVHPGRKDPSALRGWARALVTVWVLVVVPVLLALMVSAVLLLPHLATSAWDSGRHILSGLPHEVSNAQVFNALASVLELLALALPVAGSALVTQKMVRSLATKAYRWSAGRPARRAGVIVAAGTIVGLLAWAWWPSGQYQPVQASQKGTLPGLVKLISSPSSANRWAAAPTGTGVAPTSDPTSMGLTPGRHLVVAMIPDGPVSRTRPEVFLLAGRTGRQTTELVNFGGSRGLTAFPFILPNRPGPGDTQALALGQKDGSVNYTVAYGVITVSGGSRVTNRNSAYALAACRGCTTVAVSFQVVLVVGQSNVQMPVNTAEALNYDCPACTTAAIADQMVVTLKSQPSQALLNELETDLKQLNLLSVLGPHPSAALLAADVSAVEQQVDTVLAASGLLANPPSTSTSGSGSTIIAPGSATSPGSTSSVTAQPAAPANGSSATTVPATSPTTATTGTTPDTTGTSGTTVQTTSPPSSDSSTTPTTTVAP